MNVTRFVWVWTVLVCAYAMRASQGEELALLHVSGLFSADGDTPWMAALRWVGWGSLSLAFYGPVDVFSSWRASAVLSVAWVLAVFSAYDPRAFGHGPSDQVLRYLHRTSVGCVFLAVVIVFSVGGHPTTAVSWAAVSLLYSVLFLATTLLNSVTIPAPLFMIADHLLLLHFAVSTLLPPASALPCDLPPSSLPSSRQPSLRTPALAPCRWGRWTTRSRPGGAT